MNKLTKAAVLLAALQLPALPGCGGGTRRTGNPDIVLIVIDTIRSDHLSINGYRRETTPVIDSLAAGGTMWTCTQAQSCWILPSMASVMTGLPQKSHRAGHDGGELFGMDQSLPTIPLLLKRNAKYQTAAFFNSSLIGEAFGFHSGFDHFDCRGFLGKNDIRDARRTVNDFLEWYDSERDPEKPLFTAIHFFDPHMPYSPPPPFDRMYSDPKIDPVFNMFWGTRSDVEAVSTGAVSMDGEQLEIITGLYDGELSFTDSQIGRLISGLGDRDALGNTVFVIVGSHGEEFLDHGGLGHGHTLYRELLDVPLIMSGIGVNASIQGETAAQIDILPTLLGLAGVQKPIWAEGRDLLSAERSMSSRYIQSGNLLWSDNDLLSIRMENRIIIGNPGRMDAVLFDLDNDPKQQNPMVPSRDSRDQLFYYWSIPPRAEPRPVLSIGGANGNLRDLGYVR